jgi:hypothetical protein
MKPSILFKILHMALCGLVSVVGSSPTLTDAEEILYLSPSGNDAWSGTLPAPNPGKSDGPLATKEGPGRRCASGSPAEKPGIQPIDLSTVGSTLVKPGY